MATVEDLRRLLGQEAAVTAELRAALEEVVERAEDDCGLHVHTDDWCFSCWIIEEFSTESPRSKALLKVAGQGWVSPEKAAQFVKTINELRDELSYLKSGVRKECYCLEQDTDGETKVYRAACPIHGDK